MEHRSNFNLSLFIQLVKVNNKMNEKISQVYQSMGKLMVVFWSFFWDDFVIWFLYHLKNIFPND